MNQAVTAPPPVTLGWVVKRRIVKVKKNLDGRETERRTYEKVVSNTFLSQSAAEKFRELAAQEEALHPTPNAIDVSYYVTSDIGTDGLPANL